MLSRPSAFWTCSRARAAFLREHVIAPCKDNCLPPDTWWHAVDYLDRYLSARGEEVVPQDDDHFLPMAALNCARLSTKMWDFETRPVPSRRSGTHTFSMEDMLANEADILRSLDYQMMAGVSPHVVVERLLADVRTLNGSLVPDVLRHHATAFLDVALFERLNRRHAPHVVGIAAFLCALLACSPRASPLGPDTAFRFLRWAEERRAPHVDPARDELVAACAAEMMRAYHNHEGTKTTKRTFATTTAKRMRLNYSSSSVP